MSKCVEMFFEGDIRIYGNRHQQITVSDTLEIEHILPGSTSYIYQTLSKVATQS